MNWLLSTLLLCLPSAAWAAEKGQYHLFHPVPRAMLRDFDTDRPDRTESPYTLDAGHFQFETEVFGYTKNVSAENGTEEKKREIKLATVNVRAGIFSNLELQTTLPGYARTTTTVGSAQNFSEGAGDLLLRLKFNFLGNDEGQVAMALLPWVKAPTARGEQGNGAWEGGLIVPLFVHLPRGFDLETMVEIAREKDEAGPGFHNVFESSLALEHRFLGKFGAFVEVFGEASSEKGAGLEATFDTGLVYTVGESLQIDAGVYIGLTEAAEDLNPFVGFSYRL